MGCFEGKNVLVTGSTRGIGKAIAKMFLEEGAFVILNYRKKDDVAAETYKEFKRISDKVLLAKADVSRSEDVDNMFRVIESELGGVDILVNNAGLGLAYPFTQFPEDLWDKLIAINLRSAFLCSKRASRYMINRGWGRIINISSVAGILGISMLSAYSVAKAGLIGLTRVLAIELSQYNITVNAVAAGLVNTKLGLSIFNLLSQATGKEIEELSREWAKRHTLIGRILEPEEIARVVLFLADEASSGITGQVFIVDGGQTIVEGKFGLDDFI
jgi:3-oxoacyl-[acyl-carrier protein] reductase